VRIYPEFTNFNLSKAFFKLAKNTKRVPFLNEEEKQNTQSAIKNTTTTALRLQQQRAIFDD